MTNSNPPPMADPPGPLSNPQYDIADLPGDALREIARRIPCVADRDSAADVCQKWRAALREPLPEPPPPRPLPWMLLPSAGDGSSSIFCYYCGAGRCNFRRRLSPVYGARCFGTYEGGWAFLAFNQTNGHCLVNLRDRDSKRSLRRRIPLPDRLRSRRDDNQAEDMVIIAAALSSAPDGKCCIAAGIVMRWRGIAGPRRFAFWRLGDAWAVEGAMAPDALNLTGEVEDVIYYGGEFRFVMQNGSLVVCKPTFHPDGRLQRTSESLLRIRQPDCLREGVRSLYLVESRGNLLLVARFTPRPGGFPTSRFKLFQMEESVVTYDGVDEVETRWRELDSIAGRMIFVGRGCSRSYDVSPYIEMGIPVQEGVNFLDDGSFYDEAMMFRKWRDRCYSCSDNGRWDGTCVHSCFPNLKVSKQSSPMWLFP